MIEILIVDIQNAELVLNEANPSAKWETTSWNDISEVNLSTLWAILEKREYLDSDLKKFKILTKDKSSGPWVIVVPRELSKLIATSSEAQSQNVVESWSKTEEFKFMPWNVESVGKLYGDLKRLSIQSEKKNKQLVLWMSL
jgi:hypothetical protein